MLKLDTNGLLVAHSLNDSCQTLYFDEPLHLHIAHAGFQGPTWCTSNNSQKTNVLWQGH